MRSEAANASASFVGAFGPITTRNSVGSRSSSLAASVKLLTACTSPPMV